MTEISAIIRARLDEGRAIADEDVRALLNERDTLRGTLNEVMQWIHEWKSRFLQDDGWTVIDMLVHLVHQAFYPSIQEETTPPKAKEITND